MPACVAKCSRAPGTPPPARQSPAAKARGWLTPAPGSGPCRMGPGSLRPANPGLDEDPGFSFLRGPPPSSRPRLGSPLNSRGHALPGKASTTRSFPRAWEDPLHIGPFSVSRGAYYPHHHPASGSPHPCKLHSQPPAPRPPQAPPLAPHCPAPPVLLLNLAEAGPGAWDSSPCRQQALKFNFF